MKKQSRNILIGVIFVTLIIASLILVNTDIIQTSYGSSFMSIDNIDVDGVDLIRVYGVTNGAEELVIEWSASDINNQLQGEGVEATKGVSGRIELNDPQKHFILSSDTSKPFWEYKAEQVGIFKNCENNVPYGYTFAGTAGTTVTKRNCLFKRSVGNFGAFTGQTIDNNPVSINIGGATGTLNPSTGRNVVTLNDGKTKVEWVGNLVNTQGLDTPPSYGTLFQNSQHEKLIDSDAYSRSLINLNTLADNVGASGINNLGLIGTIFNIKSFTSIENAVNIHNNQINNILVDKTNTYENSINANNIIISGNKLIVDLKVATSFPTFIITLDADKVGLRELIGKPDITSCPSSQEFFSGQSANPILTVRNIGSNDGSFYGQIDCGNSGVSGTINEVLVREGQTVNMPIQVSGIAQDRDIGTSCNIKIIDRKSGDSDSCSFNVNVKYQPNVVCDPNSVSCFGADILRTCSADGSSFSDFTCEHNCQVKDGDDECIGVEPPPAECDAVKTSCEAKAIAQPWLGWSFSSELKEPSLLKKIFTFGLASDKTECKCKATFVPYYIGGAVVLLFITFIYFRVSSKKKKGGKK